MAMPVVDIRVVRMAMCDGRVGVFVRVWFPPIPWEIMRVLMMRVMHMAVRMSDGLVRVHVFMALCKVNPDTPRHEDEHHPEDPRDLLAKEQNGDCSSDERSR